MKNLIPSIFQFHKGSIKTVSFSTAGANLLNFNSIKVRLRLGCRFVVVDWPMRFQFHKGSIKTVVPSFARLKQLKFQFHKGSIKTRKVLQLFRMQPHFNSIKVRLRPSIQSKIAKMSTFQFHKGSIKT